jgi:hypothetical protein
MAFGKKKATSSGPVVNQDNVFILASQALAKQRSTRLRLAVLVTITSPGLMHRWGQKAVLQMVGNMVGHKIPKTDKDLTAEYEESWYRNVDEQPVVPCRVIRESIIAGGGPNCGDVVSKAQLGRELRVLGQTAPLVFPKGQGLTMDIQMARTSTGTPQPTARALVPAGTTFKVVLEFPPTLTPDQVMAAAQSAGDVIGLFDWRPSKGGEYGRFIVEPLPSSAAQVKAIIEACSLPEKQFQIPPEMLRAFNAIPKENLGDPARKARAVVNHVNGQRAKADEATS